MYIYSNVCFLLLNASRTCDFKNNTNKDNLILHVIEQQIFYILGFVRVLTTTTTKPRRKQKAVMIAIVLLLSIRV